MSDPRSQIRQFVVQNFLFGENGDMTNDASFLAQGIIDSTGVLELVAHIEKTYGIRVRDEELTPENLDSINAVAAYLERRLQEARVVDG